MAFDSSVTAATPFSDDIRNRSTQEEGGLAGAQRTVLKKETQGSCNTASSGMFGGRQETSTPPTRWYVSSWCSFFSSVVAVRWYFSILWRSAVDPRPQTVFAPCSHHLRTLTSVALNICFHCFTPELWVNSLLKDKSFISSAASLLHTTCFSQIQVFIKSKLNLILSPGLLP